MPVTTPAGVRPEDIKNLFGLDARESMPELYTWFALQDAAVKKEIIKAAMKGMKCLIKPSSHSKQSYIELLSMLFTLFKLVRTKGWLSIEQHIENNDKENSLKFYVFAQLVFVN